MGHRGGGIPLTRRRFLRLAALSGAGLALPRAAGLVAAAAHADGGAAPWSDPATWGGSPPGEDDVAVVSRDVLLDADARVAGVVVEQGARLIFDPHRSVALRSTGNVVVRGRLVMHPAGPRRVHRLVFLEVDESAFVGGGMDPVDSDVGLWAMGKGVLDLAGTPKRAWARAAGLVAVGATTVRLSADPEGWRVGDEIVLTPTLSPAVPDHHLAYDHTTVAAVEGRTVTLAEPTRFDHPAVDVGRGVVRAAEVLNLSRNVLVEGTEGGRTHVFVRSTRPQEVRHAAIRHVGPRQPDGEGYTTFVLGRYGLHFHHSGDGSRGSVVEGVVIRDAGSHAFVPHASHGVTFRDCVSHDTLEDAYWWDVGDEAHDTLWKRCVASMVGSDGSTPGFTLTGFLLGKGTGNVARSCVAVGVRGSKVSSGFHWPGAIAEGVWTFEDCASHDNRKLGIYTWQNTGDIHMIDRFLGYHNGRSGIFHGAYVNPYRYRDSILYGNLVAAVELSAVSAKSASIRFVDVLMDGAGLSEHAVQTAGHVTPAQRRTRFLRCDLRGYRRAAFGVVKEGTNSPDLVDVVDCAFDGNEFWLASEIHPDSHIRIQDDVHGALALRRADQEGEYRPEWNARVTEIEPFA